MTLREMFNRVEKDGFADEWDFEINAGQLVIFKDLPEKDDLGVYQEYVLNLVTEEVDITTLAMEEQDGDYEVVKREHFDKDGKLEESE